LLMPE